MVQRLCIVIPAYNEEACVEQTLRQAKRYGFCVLVDDGSSDLTASLARKMGVIVLSNPKNIGTGEAIRKGIRYAINHDYDLAVQMDADGQHDPSDIALLRNALVRRKADIVIGSRYIEENEYKTAFLRRYGILFLSGLIKLRWGVRVTDPTSGFRLYNKQAMRLLIQHSRGNCCEVLLTVEYIKKGLRIVETPVSMKPRRAGTSKLTFSKGVVCLIKNAGKILRLI